MEGTPFGRYRLVSLLGRGGMGEVWKAFDTSMNRVVALKVLPPSFADDEQFQARFRREAHMAAGLDEPHVVPIHDSGEIDGRLYVTMRLIDGKTVSELLESGPLPPERAVSIVEQIAAALNAAHRVGLVHRDVKPSNILVTDDDFAYLIDFGIARVAGSTKLTSTGTTIGTVAYMAPERFTTDTADARADTYALTCVLYECLTGVQPFPGEGIERQLAGHLTMPPPRPSVTRPGVPPQMDDVIAHGMAKNPAERYATTKAMAVAARAALGTTGSKEGAVAPPISAPPPPPLPPSLPPPVTYPTAPWSPVPIPGGQVSQDGQQRWLVPALLIGAALLGVVVIGAIVVAITWRGDSPTASPPTSKSRKTITNEVSPSSRAGVPSITVPTISTPTAPFTRAPSSAQLLTADGLNGLLASIREKFGDTMGFQMTVYPTYASFNRPDPADSRRNQGYDYRAGSWSEGIIATSVGSFDVLADLGKFDVAAVTEQIPGVAQKFDLKSPDATYLIVEGEDGGGLRIAVYVSDHGLGGRIEFNPDGSVNKVYPP